MILDFRRCRRVWVPAEERWSPPPPHVEVGVRAIVDNPFFLLADDMGGMKTAQAIIAAQFLHDMGAVDRVIVVAPASARAKVWFDQDLGQLPEQVFEDKRNVVSEYHAKVRQWAHGPEDRPALRWIVTNYEFIRTEKNLEILYAYCGPRTMLILDESNAVRTWNSAQTKACMRLRWKTNARGNPVLGVPRCGRVLELNGTPVAETPLDLFSQGNLLHPSILGCQYVTHFKARYAIQQPVLERGKPMVRYGKIVQEVAGWTNTDDLQRRFAPYVLRREAKELGIDFALPPVGLEVPLDDATWRAYKDMRDELVVWLGEQVAMSRTAAAKILRLAQITSGFLGGVEDANVEPVDEELLESLDLVEYRDRDDEVVLTIPQIKKVVVASGQPIEISREKLDFALDRHAELLARDPNLKFLVWCRFVPELRRYLKESAKRFPHVAIGAACGEPVLGGSVKKEREEALRLLHPKTSPVGPALVGATQGTGALGLNFTACRTVLDMSYDFSPWKKRQGDARVNRPGQTGPVSFHYLIAVGPRGQKTVDHHIMLTRLGKMDTADLTVKAWARRLKEE